MIPETPLGNTRPDASVRPQRPVKPALHPVSNGNSEAVSQPVTEASDGDAYIPRKERRRMEQQQTNAPLSEAIVPVEEYLAEKAKENPVSHDDVFELLGFNLPETPRLSNSYRKHASKVVKRIFQMPKDHEILRHEIGIIVDDVLWSGSNSI